MEQLPANQLLTSEITFDNYENVYDYFGQQELHSTVPRFADLVTSVLFHPRISVPEATQDYISSCRERNIPLILVANHLQYHDHNVLSAAVHRVYDLRKHTVAKTVALAKPEYFQEEKMRLKRELANAAPIFRTRDMGASITSDMLLRSNDAAIDLMLLPRLRKDHNLFMFIEGTRNTGDWSKLQQVGGMIGRLLAKAIAEDLEIGLVNMGLAYSNKDKTGLLRPFVQFGHTELNDVTEHHEIRQLVKNDLQYSVNQANIKITA